MDNASAYGAEDSRFESWQVRSFFQQPHSAVVAVVAFCITLIKHSASQGLMWQLESIPNRDGSELFVLRQSAIEDHVRNRM